MITEIHMEAVASYKHATSLVTDKKINLVYGLNGTGKSTISNFLYEPDNSAYKMCRKETAQSIPILVYNQSFIQDNFFIADNLKGIFSLAKENKAAEQRIADATMRQDELSYAQQEKRNEITQAKQAFKSQKQKAIDNVWNIKQVHAGGNGELDYCFEGLRGQKEKLFEYLRGVPKPENEPEKSVQMIRREVAALKEDSAQPRQHLALISNFPHGIEKETIFGASILGNTDSEVAALIEDLGNSDWVKEGISYLPEVVGDSSLQCPFCQKETISDIFLEKVRSYFDFTYQQQFCKLEHLLETYRSAVETLPTLGSISDHAFAQTNNALISSKYQLLIHALRTNLLKIDDKIKSPKTPTALSDTRELVADFNLEIEKINSEVDAHNDRLKNRTTVLKALRSEFWQLMRWQYDQTMTRFDNDLQAVNQQLVSLDKEIAKIEEKLIKIKREIAEAQNQTVNVEQAVTAINAGLLDLGIDDFSVQRHTDSLYRVVRMGESIDVFHSLSEGEKMMISFLYFCELCKGKASANDTHAQCIAVIDDPISSLSHIFVFNVGQLIRSVFFNGDRFSQVIVLTHSLYFFYELTDPNHERREKTQNLYRLSKSSSGSVIQKMKYEEIQNDYQAYWSVVNDQTQPPALIANCMRNIVEYFFNFVRKKDLNNVFQMAELQDTKYQAFCRYINRESHSLGQNIIDMKEFNYDVFKDGLRLVFEKTGYPDHYIAMSKY